MIKTLKIKNFECWKDIEIDFSPGLNFILGDSDEGKSSLIRAIQLNCLNEPSGTDYRSDFLTNKKDSTLVEITYKDQDKENTITRERNLTNLNEYRINNQESFVALRTNVPDEVQQISKMTEINIQGQHPNEQYFFLTKKPGQVAKELNKVSGLEIMDKAQKDINTQIREAKSEIKLFQKEIEETTEFLESSSWADEAQKKQKEISLIQNQIEEQQTKINEITSLLKAIKGVDAFLKKYEAIPQALKFIQKIEKRKTEISQLEKHTETLKNNIKSLQKIDSKLNEYTDIEKSLIALKTLKKQAEQIQTISKKKDQIQELITPFLLLEEEIQKITKEWTNLHNEFDRRLKKETCPFCNRKG